MCSAFTPDCGYDNSTIFLIGDVYCPNTKCSGKLCVQKRLLNLWAEAIINFRNSCLCARCAIFHLRIKRVPFLCQFVKGFTFLKRVQSQFKMLLERCIVPVSIVSTDRKANLLAVINQLRDPFMVVESVEHGCLFTKFLYNTRTRKGHKTIQKTSFLC